ncbi:MAG: PEGA domain-containing protein [Bacteroidales bacterium]|nr:PEGA domain-containing protein [Bacteroidales bacterium]
MKLKPLFLLLILSASAVIILSGQELMVVDFKDAPHDVSARENQLLDVNNDACGLLKVRTGLKGVTFNANLAIEKVESRSGEYWIWVSPGTSQLTFALPDFPLFEYKLSSLVEENEVYVILLIANFPEQIIYRDTSILQQFVSFNTDPQGAEVYVEDIFYGNTPLRTSMPDSVFSYTIRKKKFYEISDSHTITETINNISMELVRDPYYKRLYVLPTVGLNIEMVPLWGLQIGLAGRTGFYGSAYYSFKNAVPDIEYELEREWITPLVDIKNIYYVASSDYHGDRVNMLRINAGITQQIAKGIFLFGGIGFTSGDYYAELEKYQYITDSNYLPGQMNYETAYGLIRDFSYKGMNGNIGIILRIKEHYLISYSNTFNFKMVKNGYMMNDFNIGIGYSF